jgi:hypothetical protein
MQTRQTQGTPMDPQRSRSPHSLHVQKYQMDHSLVSSGVEHSCAPSTVGFPKRLQIFEVILSLSTSSRENSQMKMKPQRSTVGDLSRY